MIGGAKVKWRQAILSKFNNRQKHFRSASVNGLKSSERREGELEKRKKAVISRLGELILALAERSSASRSAGCKLCPFKFELRLKLELKHFVYFSLWAKENNSDTQSRDDEPTIKPQTMGWSCSASIVCSSWKFAAIKRSITGSHSFRACQVRFKRKRKWGTRRRQWNSRGSLFWFLVEICRAEALTWKAHYALYLSTQS